MNENLLNLFLLLQVSLLLSHASVGLFPVLRTIFVALSHVHYTLQLLDSLTHARMQLLLHRVQMVAHVLAESNKEAQGLLQTLSLQVDVGSQLEGNRTVAVGLLGSIRESLGESV